MTQHYMFVTPTASDCMKSYQRAADASIRVTHWREDCNDFEDLARGGYSRWIGSVTYNEGTTRWTAWPNADCDADELGAVIDIAMHMKATHALAITSAMQAKPWDNYLSNNGSRIARLCLSAAPGDKATAAQQLKAQVPDSLWADGHGLDRFQSEVS